MGIGNWFKRKALQVNTGFLAFSAETGLVPQSVREFAKEGYSENPIVFACANKIAEAAASVKLELHTILVGGDRKVETTGKVLDLLARPNPTQTWEDFIVELVIWHRVAGEAFVLRLPEKGRPVELYLLNPAHVEIEPGEGGVPKAYVYGKGEGKKTFPVNPLTGVSQVLHLKTVNLLNPWRGLSPLSPGARAVDIHNRGSKWNSSLLFNGARPSGVVEITGAADETTLSRLREYFKKAWEGAGNAGNVPLLAGGAKFTQLSHNPKDMDFKNNMGEAAKNMALVYGVPLPLVTMEASTFSNMDAAQERLWIETVLPLLNSIIKKLSNFLMPLFDDGKGKELAYNADSVPALEPRRERLYKRMAAAVSAGLITPDEARAEMGFPELGGNASVLLVPGTVKPLSQAGDQPADLVKAMRASGFTPEEVAKAIGPEFHLGEAA